MKLISRGFFVLSFIGILLISTVLLWRTFFNRGGMSELLNEAWALDQVTSKKGEIALENQRYKGFLFRFEHDGGYSITAGCNWHSGPYWTSIDGKYIILGPAIVSTLLYCGERLDKATENYRDLLCGVARIETDEQGGIQMECLTKNRVLNFDSLRELKERHGKP